MRFNKSGRIDGLGTAAILAALLCWSFGPISIRYLSGYLDAWSQNLWRYTFAMFFWLPFLLLSIRRGRVSPTIWKFAILPGLINIAMQSLWAWSLYFVEPGFGTLLARSSLIWTTAFSLIYFHNERRLVTSRTFWTAMFLSVSGLLIVIVTKEGFTARASLIGIVLVLSSSMGWTLYTICVQLFFKNVDYGFNTRFV